MLLADDLEQLLNVLPAFINAPLEKHPRREYLIEVVLDIGRRPEARFLMVLNIYLIELLFGKILIQFLKN